MSALELRRAQKEILHKASRRSAEAYFQRASQQRRWLPVSNRYRRTCVERYAADTRAAAVNDSQLAQYVGASAPAHAIDGWSCLGRAMDSALRRDTYSAVHFGYYAELRATMSLLAGEGIGIFNLCHPVIDAAGATHRFPRTGGLGTHKVVWPIFRYWSTLKRASDLIDEIVSPALIPLSEWLSASGAAVPMRAVAQRWLSSWGVDLAAFDDDHDNRNLASYRPSEFRSPPHLDIHEVAQFVEELWRLFEPSTARRFPTIERLLLRRAWRRGGAIPASASIEQLGVAAPEAAEWAAFLKDPSDSMPLRLAEEQSGIEDPRCHLRIISRAALMLFVATSAARRLLTQAAYTAETLSFWWQRQGEDRGLWNAASRPDNPLDLWADISNALDTSGLWRSNNSPGSSLRDWRQTQMAALDGLGSFELVGIWGLLP